jgi:sensor domain CHASE-containing protein
MAAPRSYRDESSEELFLVSHETLNTILAGIAALTGVVVVWLTIRYNRQRRREREEDRQLVEEQLELARDQAEMRPNLRVSEVRLLEADVPKVGVLVDAAYGHYVERLGMLPRLMIEF